MLPPRFSHRFFPSGWWRWPAWHFAMYGTAWLLNVLFVLKSIGLCCYEPALQGGGRGIKLSCRQKTTHGGGLEPQCDCEPSNVYVGQPPGAVPDTAWSRWGTTVAEYLCFCRELNWTELNRTWSGTEVCCLGLDSGQRGEFCWWKWDNILTWLSWQNTNTEEKYPCSALKAVLYLPVVWWFLVNSLLA